MVDAPTSTSVVVGNRTKAHYLVTTIDTRLRVIGDPMSGVQRVNNEIIY